MQLRVYALLTQMMWHLLSSHIIQMVEVLQFLQSCLNLSDQPKYVLGDTALLFSSLDPI